MPTATAGDTRTMNAAPPAHHHQSPLQFVISTIVKFIWRVVNLYYFPTETVRVGDILVRTLFSTYYVPIFTIVMAAGHSFVMNVIYTLVVPVLQHEESLQRMFVEAEENPHGSGSLEEAAARVTAHLANLGAKLVPFATLGMCIAAFTHKTMNVIVEAMVDAFSTLHGRDYPLLAAMLKFSSETKARVVTFSIVLGAWAMLTIVAFQTELIMVWSSREARVKFASVAIVFIQFVYIVATVVSQFAVWESEGTEKNLRSVIEHFTTAWWESSIHRIRFFALQLLFFFFVSWAYTAGPADAVSNTVETLVYLNTPHLFGFTVLTLTVSITRMFQSIIWLGLHREHRRSVLVLALPYQSLLAYAAYYFHPSILALAVISWASIHLWVRCIELCREYHVGPKGPVDWAYADTNEPLPVNFAIVLEGAMERGKDAPAVVSLDNTVSIRSMTITAADGTTRPIKRTVRSKVSAAGSTPSKFEQRRESQGNVLPQDPIGIATLITYFFPRLLVLQPATSFSGWRFNAARLVARVFTGTLLVIFTTIVSAVVLQSTVPAFQPLPVRASVSNDLNTLHIDHPVLDFRVVGKGAPKQQEGPGNPSASQTPMHLCATEFSGIHLWELSWLSTVAYLHTYADMEHVLGFMNRHMGTSWELRGSTRQRHAHPTEWRSYYEYRERSRNVVVLAVKGTDLTSFKDWFQDIDMFFEAFMYQLLTNVVPGTSVLPTDLVTDFIHLASKAGNLGFEHQLSPPTDSDGLIDDSDERHYYNKVAWRAEQILQELDAEVEADGGNSDGSVRRPAELLVTGHSLGGAIAHIAGTRVDRRSVGFSSPGLVLSRKKFNVTLDSINRNTFTVVGSHDIVPYIGWQSGELHHMTCIAQRRELCHANEFIATGLWQHCPSLQQRFPGIERVSVRAKGGAGGTTKRTAEP